MECSYYSIIGNFIFGKSLCDSVTFSRETITIDVKPITYDELYNNEETIAEA